MNNKENLWFIADGDLETTPSQLYHENSKIGAHRAEFNQPSKADEQRLEEIHKLFSGKHKAYDYAAKHPLTFDLEAHGVDFASVLRKRRTQRSFEKAKLSAATLSRILTLSAGPCGAITFTDGTPLQLRAYPSAGAMFPLEIYPLLLNVEDFPRGVYHYDVYEAQLSFLLSLDDEQWLRAAFLGEQMTETASAIFLITAVLPRMSFKYGERAYRYTHIEAGHLAQNLILTATECGLASAPVGGFLERRIETLLDIDGVEEIAVYTVFVGGLSEEYES
jgi:SagB-type dehydrogenase family enzyme